MSKLVESKFTKVIVRNRNPEAEAMSTFVGSNNIVINGKKEIKHYRLQLDKEVELPEPCIDQLKTRSMVVKGKDGETKRVPMFLVEAA